MKVLTILAMALGFSLLANHAKAANLDAIWELDKTAKYYSRLSEEVAKGTSELQQLSGCESTAFDKKFKPIFTQKSVVFTESSNKLIVQKCSARAEKRLMNVIRALQVESVVWSQLYTKALEEASQTDAEAKKQLTREQTKQNQLIEKVKAESEAAKNKNGTNAGLILVTALGLILIAAASGFLLITFIVTVIEFTAAAVVTATAPTLILLAVLGAGYGMRHYSANALEENEAREAAYEIFQIDVKTRAEALSKDQKFINAIQDNGDGENGSLEIKLH